MISPEVWFFIVGGLITVLGSYFAAKAAGRASVKVAEVSADEGAYVRAQGIYEKIIDQLQEDNAELKSSNAELRVSNAKLKKDNAQLRARVARVERRLAELESGHSIQTEQYEE